MKMRHPVTKGATTAATDTSRRVLEARGWEPVDADTLAGQHTRAQLDELAADADLDPAAYDTKQDLAEALADGD